MTIPLNQFCYIHSIGTDAFYNKEEQYRHIRLIKLYKLRKQEKEGRNRKWRLQSINRVIAKEKTQLSILLKQSLADNVTRELNLNSLKDKTIINLFCSELTRSLDMKPKELSDKVMIVNVFFFEVLNSIIHNGFNYNGEHYIFLCCGAGMIRTKRFMAIKESEWNRIQPKMMCGLSIDKINSMGGMNENKLMAYLSLNSSASDEIEDFDIDKAIVVDDFEMDVEALSDFIDYTDYSITRKVDKTTITETDGWGMCCSPGYKTKIIRAPWIKGLVTYFNFKRYLLEECDPSQYIVTDIYGKEWNIIEDGIEWILTKSQFKLSKFYSSWEEYKTLFKQNGCHFAFCKEEEDKIPNSHLNYQIIQSLSDMTDDEIDKLIKPTVEEINSVGSDYQVNMRLLGATEYNRNPNYFQQALMIYPELFRDVYHKEILKQTKKSLVKQARAGKLKVNGKYLLISPDPVAFCEYLFKGELEPKGLLADGEVYTNQYTDRSELDCLRSPHLYQEHAVRKNNRSAECEKWLGQTKCLYTSCHDMISKILQNDFDGDISLVVKNRTLSTVAKRNMKDIVPLSYDLKKARGGLITPDSLYEGISVAYTGGNIGIISNQIAKVKNAGGKMTDEQIKVLAWLTMSNNQIIDYAKTLWRSDPPKEIDKIIKSYTKRKLPNFFIYAKDKIYDEDKDIYQVEKPNNSTMNRISAKIPNPKLKYSKTIAKFDYTMLMNKDADFTVKQSPIIDAYNYWVIHRKSLNSETMENYDALRYVDNSDYYIHQYIRNQLLSLGEKDYVVNTLINYAYTVKKSSNKKMLWACFGEEIVANLKVNTQGIGNICPVCGRRFNGNSPYCSSECERKMHNQTRDDRRLPQYQNPQPLDTQDFHDLAN